MQRFLDSAHEKPTVVTRTRVGLSESSAHTPKLNPDRNEFEKNLFHVEKGKGGGVEDMNK